MNLTSEHLFGGKSMSGMSEDISFVVRYNWESSKHMKEAIKIMLIAILDAHNDRNPSFEGEMTAEQKDVQLKLACNPQTSEKVLDYLRKVGDKRVCERIAMNPRSPEPALRTLANHPEPEVRAGLSENPCCPVTILYHLTRDEHADVRLRLAENPNMPLSILEELSEDENPFVAAQAKATIRRFAYGTVVEGDFPGCAQTPYLRALAT